MRHRIPVRRDARLKERLDQLVETFDLSTISPDPLQLVLRYDDPRDQEVVALIAAAFAYGRAGIIVRNVGALLQRCGDSPYHYLHDGFSIDDAKIRFRDFSHRFHKTSHVVELFSKLHPVLQQFETLGSLFRTVYDERDRDLELSLSRFVAVIASADGVEPTKSLAYLLSSPRDGSACKRMNLFLRWMIRRHEPDLGLWSFADPAKLVMPLDTHVHRISRFLGLSDRLTADWKCARLLTDRFAEFDPADPVRYDFAICRLGILDRCSRKRKKELCDVCLLNDVCRFPVTT